MAFSELEFSKIVVTIYMVTWVKERQISDKWKYGGERSLKIATFAVNYPYGAQFQYYIYYNKRHYQKPLTWLRVIKATFKEHVATEI